MALSESVAKSHEVSISPHLPTACLIPSLGDLVLLSLDLSLSTPFTPRRPWPER